MKIPMLRRGSLLLIAITVLAVAGCAKKAAETPPTPPPTPPVETQPTPTPPPVETPPTPPAPSVTSSSFQPVFYDYDSAQLTAAGRSALDGNARVLRDNPTASVTIEGHCDERGTVEYNQALGERRAQAARDYLAAAGIPSSRMQIISYGKERPFDLGHDEAAWAKNRRAHFTVP